MLERLLAAAETSTNVEVTIAGFGSSCPAQVEKLRGELRADAFILVLEKDVGVVPLLREDTLSPMEQICVIIVRPPQPDVAPTRGGDEITILTLFELGKAKRAVALAQTSENLVIEPGWVAKLESRSPAGRQKRQKALQPIDVFTKVGRKLKKNCANLFAHHRGDTK